MDRVISYEIKREYKDMWSFFKEKKYPKSLRTQLKQHPSQVQLNGKETFLYESMEKGDWLEITIKENQQSSMNLKPLDVAIDVVYEDEDILVVNKPAGMSIHPSVRHYEDSLANAILSYLEKKGERIIFRCVNRLDKETSGLTVIAKNMLAGAILSEEVKHKEMKREYR
ncbi:MAG: RluA family pseudouridine synthase, partial [Lachnospiraceae bacterium]|nr:RluA family pseudouridine synthase [Lachnospiraceae bacterium]